MNKDIEKLLIYNKYLDLFYYSYNIMKKFPKYEREVLCSDLRRLLEDGYKNIIYAYDEGKLDKKIKYLRDISSDLRVIGFYIRVSYKEKYISIKNYEAWSRKLNGVCNNLNNWIGLCQRRLKPNMMKN